jgi:hypothetical protein
LERRPTSSAGRRAPQRAAIALAAGTSLAGALLIVPAVSRAQAVDPRGIAERIHDEGGYPSDIVPLMPDGDRVNDEGAGRGAHGETSIDGEREAGERGTGDGTLSGWKRDLLEWLGGLLGAVTTAIGAPLAYLLLAIGLALVAVFVGFLFVHFRLPAAKQRVSASSTGERDELDPMLVGPRGTPDELAAQGRWGEAIHALFLVTLDRVGGREGRLRSRTAREIVRSIDPSAVGREQLAALLDTTELVWFGGREATEEQYRAARALADAVPERGPDVLEEDAA